MDLQALNAYGPMVSGRSAVERTEVFLGSIVLTASSESGKLQTMQTNKKQTKQNKTWQQ